MKGTLFSADFVTDKDNNLRLIEINTDTGIVNSQQSILDWTDFINILNTNSITDVDVVYKYDIQHPIVESLETQLSATAPNITLTKTVVPSESIFPTSPEDSANKFILRMAYDESAILDSEYAKGTLGLLKLFADAGDTGSVTNFYHSSSNHGEYNTLDNTIFNGELLPDVVTKTVLETHTPHKFYKIGNSNLSSTERYDNFIGSVATSEDILQQYHIPQSSIDGGIVKSSRTFQIVYGSNLDLCYVAEYEIDAVLGLPTAVVSDDSNISNLLEQKHYYEFATNTVKNRNHGLLENETILDTDNNQIAVKDLVLGNSYKSYYIEGVPNTDDYDVLREWSSPGSTLPSGSFPTASILVGKFEDVTFANDLTEIVLADSTSVVIGGEARMLVYSQTDDVLRFERVTDLDTTYSLVSQDNSLNPISEINLIIYDEQQPVYTMNMEDVDNFILGNGSFHSFYITHNLGISGGCFTAGTKIITEGGVDKNIEEIEIGDFVLSFNEETNTTEYKKVIATKQPIHNDLVKYHFANQTSLTCTFDHPIYVNGLDLASYSPELSNARYDIDSEISKIKVGDMVKVPNAGHSAIREIEVLPTADTQTYIFTVEDNHNFYANGILVHNK